MSPGREHVRIAASWLFYRLDAIFVIQQTALKHLSNKQLTLPAKKHNQVQTANICQSVKKYDKYLVNSNTSINS